MNRVKIICGRKEPQQKMSFPWAFLGSGSFIKAWKVIIRERSSGRRVHLSAFSFWRAADNQRISEIYLGHSLAQQQQNVPREEWIYEQRKMATTKKKLAVYMTTHRLVGLSFESFERRDCSFYKNPAKTTKTDATNEHLNLKGRLENTFFCSRCGTGLAPPAVSHRHSCVSEATAAVLEISCQTEAQ